MSRRKEPTIPDALLDQLLAGAEAKTAFDQGGFIAGYNGQIAVNAAHQIIVAHSLQTDPADFGALVPLVEPVFGQIKHARGYRQMLLRGLANVRGEWELICTAPNPLKLAKATG